MKTLFLSLFMSSSSLFGCSQDITPSNLPSVVQNSLQTKFPGATAIEWEKNGTNYEAEFLVAQKEYTALIDPAGQLISVKEDLSITDLPETIAQAVKREYQAYEVEDVEKVEKDGQVYYQVELDKRFKEVKKVYAANGTATQVPYWD